MNATKHTPGPWSVHTTKPGQYAPNHCCVVAMRETDEESVLICELNTTVRNPLRFPKDTLADATLMAASPDLLEALQAALCSVMDPDARKLARAAVRKAGYEPNSPAKNGSGVLRTPIGPIT